MDFTKTRLLFWGLSVLGLMLFCCIATFADSSLGFTYNEVMGDRASGLTGNYELRIDAADAGF